MSLSLKIDNQFIALPDSTEISIEASNPIFSDAGAKTYLFEIPVESLRYIIGNADEIYGESLYDVLEGKRAEIYIDGVQFFSGVVNLEDEISIEDGKIAVSIASGNLEFEQMIEGMNCRDVELKDEIEIGWAYDSYSLNIYFNPECNYYDHNHPGYDKWFTFDFPSNYIAITSPNISNPYNAKFCTIRRAYSISNKAEVDKYIEEYESYTRQIGTKEGSSGSDILSLEYNSINSGLCFFVLYFLDCLENKLGIKINKDDISTIEDVRRVAFVNNKCGVKRIGSQENVDAMNDEVSLQFPGFFIGNYSIDRFGDFPTYLVGDRYFTRQKVVATSVNFPNESVSVVLESFFNMINAKLLRDGAEWRIVLVRDILRDSSSIALNIGVYEAKKVHNRRKGFRLSYSSDDDNDVFNFDYGSFNVEPIESYAKALWNVRTNNKTIYCDIRNGNTYAIKVDNKAEEDGNYTELHPALFEVGAFIPVEYGDCSNEDLIEDVQLGYSPIVNNDINGSTNKSRFLWTPESLINDSVIENIYALAIEENIENPRWVENVIKDTVQYRLNNGAWDKKSFSITLKYFDYLGATNSSKESPVNAYDPGFMLGIMRGPGSDAEPETFAQDFDGEGNYRVAFTAANYAFTSDSIDNCNRDFDYNGTAEGVGPDELKGRFSLKLRAGKYDKDGNPIKDADGNPIVIQDKSRAERGLYDTFWKEYAYFTVNKKIIHLTCGMKIADIVNLDWTKRYKIGEWTGFIANYSFNVNKDGMSEVELDMYYL